MPVMIWNLLPNPAIHVELEGLAESQEPLNLPRKRKAFPDLEKFTGDRRDFKRWHFEILHKLKAD